MCFFSSCRRTSTQKKVMKPTSKHGNARIHSWRSRASTNADILSNTESTYLPDSGCLHLRQTYVSSTRMHTRKLQIQVNTLICIHTQDGGESSLPKEAV